MSTPDLLNLIRRRLSLLLVFIFLGFSISFYATGKIVPQYESTATIFVSTPPTIDNSGGSGGNKLGELAVGNSFTQARVKSYATIINNEATLSPVIQSLNLQYDVEALAKKVSAIAPEDTVLMYVKVRDTDPILAASIANVVAQQFSQTVLEIELNSSLDLTQLIKLSVVRAAIVSEFPATPNKRLNYLLGIFVGFMFGFIISLLLRFLDQSLKSEKDIGDTPLLGVVAFDPSAVSQPLITQLSTYAIRTEAFRLFRTNLLHSLDKKELNCIAISSCYSGEGKSTSTLNLSFAIAQSGFSVVVVEADMRRPSLAKYLNENWGSLPISKFGLSEILCANGNTELRRKMNAATLTLPKVGLDIILSGTVPSNPAELLGGENFVTLVEMLKTKYDYVLIDTPPVLSVADASIVSRVTQQIALILHAGKTSKRNFEAAREGMSSVGVNLTGVLLNKVPKHKAGEHYGYTYSDPQMGYYRYSYSYSPEKIEQKKRVDINQFRQLRKRLDSKLKSNDTPERSIVSENDTFEDFLKKYKID